VLELFSELHRQGNTILIVTHDLEIASLANRQVEIHDGRIASSTEKVA
jgi:ABC-type lipoprotein export system ATPase subunit